MQQVILCCLTSKSGDWTIRIDPPHGNQSYHRKHVHIQKRGVKGEYSWNIDGSRHDEHRFPTSEKCISAAREHAATALGVPASTLSFVVAVPGGVRISARLTSEEKYEKLPLFNAYVSVKLSFIVFGSSTGLVLVLNEDA